MKKIKTISTILFILLFCDYTLADIINVPGDQPTIQQGINAANNGDTVLVANGTYTGQDNKNMDFCGKSITVTSINGAENTIIDCEGDGRGFYFHSGEDSTSVVDGFTITNGFGEYGTGVYCFNSSPRLINLIMINGSANGGGGIMCHNYANPILSNLTITDNGADLGGGIMCWQNSSPKIKDVEISNNQSNLGAGANFLANSCPTLENVTIHDNFSYLSGGGISCSDNSNITLKNVTISGNTSNGSGGGIYCASSSPILDSVIISDNTTVMQGGGILFIENSNPTLTNVIISNNLVTGENSFCASGGGIAIINNSNPILRNIFISDNSVTGGPGNLMYGGGIHCIGSNPDLEDITISGNSASGSSQYIYGGGILFENCSPIIRNVTISDNSAGYGGGVFCWLNASPSLINVTISQNTAVDGGGICCMGNSTVNLLNSIIWNDTPNEISGSITATYSDIQDGWTGIGNIDTDPLFTDPANGDFHLTWENFPIPDDTKSPCIDAGDLSSPPDPDGTIADMGAFYFDQVQTGIEEDEILLQSKYHLFQNYPNPFSQSTVISYQLSVPGKVVLKIFDMIGQEVRTLVNENHAAGNHSVVWDRNDDSGNAVEPGVYFYRFSLDDNFSQAKKMLIIK